MSPFRLFLVICLAILTAYTAMTIAHHGMGLLPIFFGNIAAMTWPGQFNLDFFMLLLLSGLWVAWRHHFNLAGLLLAVVAVFGGMGFLAAYLLFHNLRSHGDIRVLLLGPTRATRG